MALGHLVRDLSRRHLQGSVEIDHAVSLVVVRVPGGSSGPERHGGCVRSNAWIEVFSSTLRTIACSGGFKYSPTTSFTFAANCGSRLTLYVRTRCGFTSRRRRQSDTAPLVIPNSFASSRVVQRDRPAGGGDIARFTIWSTSSGRSA